MFDKTEYRFICDHCGRKIGLNERFHSPTVMLGDGSVDPKGCHVCEPCMLVPSAYTDELGPKCMPYDCSRWHEPCIRDNPPPVGGMHQTYDDLTPKKIANCAMCSHAITYPENYSEIRLNVPRAGGELRHLCDSCSSTFFG